MSSQQPIDPFIHKRVRFRFHGQDLQFALSRSLFGSHDVDEGTRHLLASLARYTDLPQANSALDVGCGTGVLGIALKRAFPGLAVTLQDTDALALAFTRHNAQLNQVSGLAVNNDLALHNLGASQFDLIVSNLPGKAGPPVLRDIVARIPGQLTGEGRAALVVIAPVADLVESFLSEVGLTMLLKEKTSGHTLFHCQRQSPSPSFEIASPVSQETAGSGHDPLSAYVRGEFRFTVANVPLALKTVYGISEFDTISFQTSLAANLLKSQDLAGSLLFWNPGQGHLPVYCAGRDKERNISRYVIAGRDLLSLKITRLNLERAGVDPALISLLHRPHILEVTGAFDFILLFPDLDPGVPWERLLPEKCLQLLAPQGSVLLTAKSAFMHRLLASPGAPKPHVSKRRHAFRSILMKKAATLG